MLLNITRRFTMAKMKICASYLYFPWCHFDVFTEDESVLAAHINSAWRRGKKQILSFALRSTRLSSRLDLMSIVGRKRNFIERSSDEPCGARCMETLCLPQTNIKRYRFHLGAGEEMPKIEIISSSLIEWQKNFSPRQRNRADSFLLPRPARTFVSGTPQQKLIIRKVLHVKGPIDVAGKNISLDKKSLFRLFAH